jgi:hypothetical protein
MGSENMRVRKHAKKVTMLEERMLENGEMDFVEIKNWMNDRIRGGITSAWLGNVLAKCGLFVQTGEVRVAGIGYNYVVKVWDSARRNSE